jgi:hypothetical protein
MRHRPQQLTEADNIRTPRFPLESPRHSYTGDIRDRTENDRTESHDANNVFYLIIRFIARARRRLSLACLGDTIHRNCPILDDMVFRDSNHP